MDSKEDWPTTDALVYSVEWFDPSRADHGHYKVVYSYAVGDERYSGQFYDYGTSDESYLHRDDAITIEYDRDRPEHSRYPLARAARRILPDGATWALRIIVVIFVLLILLFGWRK